MSCFFPFFFSFSFYLILFIYIFYLLYLFFGVGWVGCYWLFFKPAMFQWLLYIFVGVSNCDLIIFVLNVPLCNLLKRNGKGLSRLKPHVNEHPIIQER